MMRRQSLPMLALPALAMILAALLPAQAAAQEARQAEPAASADSLYCEQRRLGYWFYCVKPVPANEPQMAPTEWWHAMKRCTYPGHLSYGSVPGGRRYDPIICPN